MEKHIFVGLLIPVAFLGFTGFVKSLIKKELMWSNFYLGIDIALAALANGIVNILDEVHVNEQFATPTAEFVNQMYYTSVFLVCALGALLVTMTLHQKFEVADVSGVPLTRQQRVWRGLWLGVISNTLGGALLAVFIYMKLRRLL
jgi:hypothetical protein